MAIFYVDQGYMERDVAVVDGRVTDEPVTLNTIFHSISKVRTDMHLQELMQLPEIKRYGEKIPVQLSVIEIEIFRNKTAKQVDAGFGCRLKLLGAEAGSTFGWCILYS